ncbi:Putative metallopeptidase, catalytic domain superfamily [Colletotrichum destructivum]|uniref:Metallopeptidase, catalytic domain superfamily n=1 Tax=Colletotrichum destructivum TaxID=34406 RepID=A0AAX4IC25_9PEZI|nr:Putative metallopeptidase, catalytic domain superfamily [Colletotrichum destructivum]
MQLFCSYFFLFTFLPFCLGFRVHSQNPRLQYNKRDITGNYVIDQQENSPFGCSESQIIALERAITEARYLAGKASAVLGKPGSEFSQAYRLWFGMYMLKSNKEDNSKPATRDAIRKNNFDAVRQMKWPGPTNRVPQWYNDNLSPTGLTFTCAAENDESCSSGTIAMVYEDGHQHQGHKWAGNVILLCRGFFLKKSHKTMIKTWRKSKDEASLSAGFALLHEVQHISAIVGKERRCIDAKNLAPAPNDVSKLCYHYHWSNSCANIPDAMKISNAQNMAFFALEVTANPTTGEPSKEQRQP